MICAWPHGQLGGLITETGERREGGFLNGSDGPLTPENFLARLDLDDVLWAIATRDRGWGVTIREANAALGMDVGILRWLFHDLSDRGYIEPARGIGRYRLTAIGRLWTDI